MLRYAVVTGCSKSSIGFLAAKALAGPPHNFRVVLACRNERSGNEAEAAIRSEHPDSKAIYIHLDLSSFASIRYFVSKLGELDNGSIQTQGLSILVNNAGVGWNSNTPYIETEEGIEEIVGVNHFGHFLLTNLLLEYVKKAEKARIVILSSTLHDPNGRKKDGQEDQLLLPSFPEGIIPKADNFDGAHAYRVSKLCNVWFAYELHRRLEDSHVVVNALSPGFIPTTGLSRRYGPLAWFAAHWIVEPMRFFGLIGFVRSQDEGAKAVVEACVGIGVASKGGQYLCLPIGKNELELKKSSIESYDETKAREAWNISHELCKL
jgi:NAD(P)-dependent dehydrogenase (short-subunit alcohol dehydrogenase family)